MALMRAHGPARAHTRSDDAEIARWQRAGAHRGSARQQRGAGSARRQHAPCVSSPPGLLLMSSSSFPSLPPFPSHLGLAPRCARRSAVHRQRIRALPQPALGLEPPRVLLSVETTLGVQPPAPSPLQVRLFGAEHLCQTYGIGNTDDPVRQAATRTRPPPTQALTRRAGTPRLGRSILARTT